MLIYTITKITGSAFVAFIETTRSIANFQGSIGGGDMGFGTSCARAFPIYMNTRSLNAGAVTRCDLKIVHRGVKPLLPIKADGRCPYAN